MDLKINVGNLPKEGSTLEFCFKEEDVSVEELIGDTLVRFVVCKNGNSYDVKGFMEYRFSLTCSRCLKELIQHKRKKINLEFKEKLNYDIKEKSGRKTGETENEFIVEDNCLDLGPFLRDEIILSMTFKPLCSEECKGLCPVCGTNLNEAICEHVKIEEKSFT